MPSNHLHSPRFFRLLQILIIAALLTASAGCSAVTTTSPGLITVTLVADGKETPLEVPGGASVQNALDKAALTLGSLDRVDPASYTVITAPLKITVTRVREEFEVEETIIPFKQQEVRNESMPKKQEIQLQKGVNGKQQITYRRVYEDNKEVSRTIFKTTTLVEALPEITMVGVQAPFASFPIPGRIAYLTAGNAWVMTDSTGSRKPVVTTGDLDGRVFSLSRDGNWLLFTRKGSPDDKDAINSLWVARISDDNPKPRNLEVKNIIHFAEWVPGANLTIAYSTVEPRSTAPGWQANNDLQFLTFSAGGAALKKKEILESNSGGIYGWWGTSFAWSPNGNQLAYARPDSIGLVDIENSQLSQLKEIIPLQTRGDWAWVPPLAWADGGKILYTVDHTPMAGLTNNEASPLFDLTALLMDSGATIPLSSQTGMFAYPVPSPALPGGDFLLAYLQAISPDKSETSRYRLMVSDRDGSNRSQIFPDEGSAGLEPQTVVWAPQADENNIFWLAVNYQGNLWLVDPINGKKNPITGDGLITKIAWK